MSRASSSMPAPATPEGVTPTGDVQGGNLARTLVRRSRGRASRVGAAFTGIARTPTRWGTQLLPGGGLLGVPPRPTGGMAGRSGSDSTCRDVLKPVETSSERLVRLVTMIPFESLRGTSRRSRAGLGRSRAPRVRGTPGRPPGAVPQHHREPDCCRHEQGRRGCRSRRHKGAERACLGRTAPTRSSCDKLSPLPVAVGLAVRRPKFPAVLTRGPKSRLTGSAR